jgi:hypothetical protein
MNSTREGISHTKIDWHNWYQSLTANRTRQDMTTTTHFSTPPQIEAVGFS